MTNRIFMAALFAALVAPASAQDEVVPSSAPAPATASVAVNLTLESTSDIERKVVGYQCDNDQPLSVQYVSAAPNFLAIVPVDGLNYVFVTTISASGARYVSGPFEWWEKGGEATLRDLMQDEDAPALLTCNEVSNTP
jgi:membrane-bound inhibitor of C-type lysozyme